MFLRLNSGNVTQFGTRFVAPIEIETMPLIGRKQAYALLLEHSGDGEVARPDHVLVGIRVGLTSSRMVCLPRQRW